MVVTSASTNQALILNSSITQRGSTSALTSFDVTPVTNATGSVNVEFTVSDGATTATTTLTITINGINDAPVIATNQTAIVIDEDVSTVLTVSINDPETASTTLVVTSASSNQALILNSSITQRGSTSALTSFDVTPVTNASGSVNVEFTVSDGVTTATTTLTITINTVNDAPCGSDYADGYYNR